MPEERDKREDSFYRRQALEHYAGGRHGSGDPLRLTDKWIGWTYYVVVVLAVGLLLFLCIGHMSEYAEGAGVVRAGLTSDVTSLSAGTVKEVLVASGEFVRRGQLLVQLDDEDERAEVERCQREYDAALASYLKNMGQTNSSVLAAARSQLDIARQRLTTRQLVAPHDGTIGDVRTQAGQQILPGQSAVTLVGEGSSLTLVALLPGEFHPQLEVGQGARLEIAGYPHSRQDVVISQVGAEIIGPAEARRVLGGDIGDAVRVNGPVVLARAELERPFFIADGTRFAYTDGLQGTVQVRVRSVPIILNLLPGLRVLWEGR